VLLKSFNAKVLNALQKIAGFILEFVVQNPRKVLLAGVLLAVVSTAYAFFNLTFLPNFAGLNNSQTDYNKNFQNFSKEFNQEPAMIVVAEGNNVKDNEAFLSTLAQKLSHDPYIEKVMYKVDLKPFLAWAMAYLSPEQLRQIADSLSAAKPLLQKMGAHPNLVSFWKSILEMAENPARVSDGEKGTKGLEVLQKIINLMTEALQGKVKNVNLSLAFGGFSGLPQTQYNISMQNGNYELYLTLDNGHYAFLSAYAVKDKHGTAMLEPAIADIRKAIASIAPKFPDVSPHLTGEPVMGVDEMEIAKHGIFWAGIISLLLSSTIFVLGFMEIKKPILAVFSLFIGIGWSLGYIALSVKHLNVFTISLFPMLIGLAIDFSIQFMGRYKEEHNLLSVEDAIRKTYFSTGGGLLTAALTTALGFLGISFTAYTGIAELGTATFGSLLLCFASTMTILPALLLLTERQSLPTQKKERISQETHASFSTQVEKFLLSRAGVVVAFGALLTLVLGLNARYISFDHNILNLEAKHTDSVETELKLIKIANKSSIFAVIVADNLKQAREYVNELQTLPTVSSIQSPLAFIPQDQKKKFPILKKIQVALQNLTISDPNAPVDVYSLYAIFKRMDFFLDKAEEKLDTTGGAIDLLGTFLLPGSEIYPHQMNLPAGMLARLHATLSSFHKSVRSFLTALKKENPNKAKAILTKFQEELFDELQKDLTLMKNGIPKHPITLEDLPPVVRNEFVGKSGKILIEVFPSQNIWERPALERFVTQLQQIDPNVTGPPVLIYYTTEEMLKSYETAATVAIIVIVFVTFLEFRNLYLTLLTLTPLVLGLLWLMGIMVLFHQPFNPANMITLPVILGIGVAFGVYVVNRFREEKEPTIFSNSTGKSVLLSALTSTAGFASLLFVSHEGLKSLGFTMTAGLLIITFQALVILPSLIKVTHRAPS
jgi:hopanoid biosynthesis associated RND transporter like protein HpnN